MRPLGWDWRIGCAVLASLPAREIVVATMGVMYHLDDEPAPESPRAATRWVGETPPHHLGRHRAAGVQRSRGLVDHGVFRPLCRMRGHVGGDPPRDEQLALAGVHLRLHDGAWPISARWRRTNWECGLAVNDTMTITWQDAATAGILLVVIGYLARRLCVFLQRKGLPACGCCAQCPAEKPETPLINLDEQPDE